MEEESEAAADQSSAEDQAADQDVSPANCKAQEVCPAPTGEADSSQLAGKRKRTKPGPWWLISPVNTQLTETDNKSKQNNKTTTSKPARHSSVESGQEDGPSKPLFNQNAKKKPSSNQSAANKPSSNQTTEKKPWSNQTAEQKAEKPKKGRPKKQTIASTEEPARPEGQSEEEPARPEGQREEEQEAMPSPLRQHTLTSSEKVFDWLYNRTPKCKPQSDATPTNITPHSATVTPSRQQHQAREAPEATVTPSRQQHQAREAPEKRSSRKRKAPVNWWETNNPPENAGRTFSFPQQPQPNPKTRKVVRSKSKPRPVRTRPAKSLRPPQNASSPRPGAGQTLVKRKDLSTPKTVKRSLATFGAIFSSGREALPVATVRSTLQTSGRKALFPEEQSAQSPSVSLSPGPAKDPSQDPASDRSSSLVDLSASTVCYIEPVGKLGEKTRCRDFSQTNNRLSDNTLESFESGPSSMIELEDCEEHEDIWLPSSRVTPHLSIHPSVHPSVPPGIVLSDPEAVTVAVCAPPLRAITLQLEDKANLADWLALLWPATGKQGGQISPDHFQWFSYRDSALGYKMDLLAETFSNGKILLGSYMKIPLLVDHSATTVYNLLTSSVTVTINGKENHYNPGQTFMVPCGHAYSLHNLTQEPAALHFTRMLAESSE
ncbi:protein piccolo-like [Coregonus clupeaformis]|uniref:protein piccolo-like n=1 Tax=Coregonus clupeaformis TaxID=59861 RepID=UPI001E1C7372|nr:protein piccolo-like [Coregonus clupeaformis]